MSSASPRAARHGDRGRLRGVLGGSAAPAGALAVVDQPLSATASPIWQTNNTVWALEAGAGVVYAGGSFSSVRPPGSALGVNEVARNRLAAFNANTGALITTFNPNLNGIVYDLDISNDGTKLYVAGSFTTVVGVTRQRVSYGVNVGGVHQAIEAPIRYNNGLWHHVVATQGVGGMRIYVDGLLVASNATVVTPDAATGYWRVGGGLLTGWPNAPSSSVLNATFDELAVYPTELTAAQILTHFAAAAT